MSKNTDWLIELGKTVKNVDVGWLIGAGVVISGIGALAAFVFFRKSPSRQAAGLSKEEFQKYVYGGPGKTVVDVEKCLQNGQDLHEKGEWGKAFDIYTFLLEWLENNSEYGAECFLYFKTCLAFGHLCKGEAQTAKEEEFAYKLFSTAREGFMKLAEAAPVKEDDDKYQKAVFMHHAVSTSQPLGELELKRKNYPVAESLFQQVIHYQSEQIRALKQQGGPGQQQELYFAITIGICMDSLAACMVGQSKFQEAYDLSHRAYQILQIIPDSRQHEECEARLRFICVKLSLPFPSIGNAKKPQKTDKTKKTNKTKKTKKTKKPAYDLVD